MGGAMLSKSLIQYSVDEWVKSVCALQELVPVLCKFWQLYSEDNGDLLQEGLCYTHVCCTQSPCPCGSPLLTRTSAEDTQECY